MAGKLGFGVLSSVAALSAAPREETVYRPALPASRVSSLYTGWQTAVRQVLAD